MSECVGGWVGGWVGGREGGCVRVGVCERERERERERESIPPLWVA